MQYVFSIVDECGYLTGQGCIMEFDTDSDALEYERQYNKAMYDLGFKRRIYCNHVSLETRLGVKIIPDATIDDLYVIFGIDRDS